MTSPFRVATSTPRRTSSRPDFVLSPWHDQVPEHDIDAGLEALQSASFDQLEPHASEFERGLILAVACAGNDRQPLVGQARSVTVVALAGQLDRDGRHRIGQTTISGE